MTEIETTKRDLNAFAAAYDYDASYMTELVDMSFGAFKAFAAAQQLGSYRSVLPVDAHAVAGISTTLTEDCGPCTQLGLRMAVQAGVDRALLQKVLEAPTELPGALADVAAHARSVCQGAPDDLERQARLRAAYGEEGLAELAVCIAGTRLYPTIKRALFKNALCKKPTLDF